MIVCMVFLPQIDPTGGGEAGVEKLANGAESAVMLANVRGEYGEGGQFAMKIYPIDPSDTH